MKMRINNVSAVNRNKIKTLETGTLFWVTETTLCLKTSDGYVVFKVIDADEVCVNMRDKEYGEGIYHSLFTGTLELSND